MGRIYRRELRPGETFFPVGAGTLIPFRLKPTEPSKTPPKPQPEPNRASGKQEPGKEDKQIKP